MPEFASVCNEVQTAVINFQRTFLINVCSLRRRWHNAPYQSKDVGGILRFCCLEQTFWTNFINKVSERREKSTTTYKTHNQHPSTSYRERVLCKTKSNWRTGHRLSNIQCETIWGPWGFFVSVYDPRSATSFQIKENRKGTAYNWFQSGSTVWIFCTWVRMGAYNFAAIVRRETLF